jgi:hypothetical protein
LFYSRSQSTDEPLQDGYTWEENFLCSQPGCGAIKQDPGTISTSPTQGVKPPVQPKLDPRIAKIAESAKPPDFRRMVPTKFALAVIKEGADLLDPQLSG